MQTIVWFEPERVTPGTWLADRHPEWVLGGSNGGLLNLGNPDAWKWLTNHIDKFLTDQGIDHYRQDFNMDPLSYWRKNDTKDRQGITEIKHVTAILICLSILAPQAADATTWKRSAARFRSGAATTRGSPSDSNARPTDCPSGFPTTGPA
jgi:hypothetical protein